MLIEGDTNTMLAAALAAKDNIQVAINEVLQWKVKLPVKSPFGEGYAGEKIARGRKEL
jgi:hypothetical protein